MKSAVKTKAKNTNNQDSFGMSLLKHNQNVDAAMELSRHLDEKGVHLVWTGLAAFFFLFAICLILCRTNVPCLDSLVKVHTLFGLCLDFNQKISWENLLVEKMQTKAKF